MVLASGARSAFGAIAAFVLLVSGAADGLAAKPRQEVGAAARAPDRTITLITGDRLVLAGGDEKQIAVIPGTGRGHVAFRTHARNTTRYVIPSDVAPLVAAGRLDRQLFDVTTLLRDGYDDRSVATIPLIVTFDGPAGPSTLRGIGAQRVRDLPAVKGAAVRVPKADAQRFMDALPTAGRRLAGGVERIWLDGKYQPALDRTVPQIGAPAAWSAGYTGEGVTVAVVDTGVDSTHPDLAGKVVEAKNFTAAPAGDQFGHGTHVASTIAGTAAASGGRYKGVAPDAKLLDAKVCEVDRCAHSAMIAAMQWAAAEKKADVINISIGGGDLPGIDPVEEAVNTLTAQTGSLFVISAGNDGPGERTVNSPGSAAAALTVGAVDKQDQLAPFSSRGPRVGDDAIKPDVTAPGVDIVAAKATEGVIGDPVGEHYTSLQGTSMAAPHVAGAAALLAQQHSEWTATDLKAALMSSAEAQPGQTVFEQGTGRIDVARAIEQQVVSQPGSLSFGLAQWPHTDDPPVLEEVLYRNHSDKAVTLALDATLTDPNGKPAPAAALTLSATSVTVPIGGTASVTATSSTRHNGPDGIYTGRVVATSPDGLTVTTPVTATKEAESYDLTVAHLGPDGRPDGAAETEVVGVDDDYRRYISEPDGTVTLRVPKGRYFLGSYSSVQRAEEAWDAYMSIRPIVSVDRDTSVTVDARQARQITTTVPRADVQRLMLEVYASLDVGATRIVTGLLVPDRQNRLFTAHLGDAVTAPDRFTARVKSVWGVQPPTGFPLNSPYSYHLLNLQTGRFFQGFERTVKDSDLAALHSRHNSQGSGRQAFKFLHGAEPDSPGGLTLGLAYDLPSRTTHYIEPGNVTWSTDFHEFDESLGFPSPVTSLVSPPRTYQAGRSYPERWNEAVHGPALAYPGFSYAMRSGDRITVEVPSHSDPDHIGSALLDSGWAKLYRNGQLIVDRPTRTRIDVDNLPAEVADFRLVTSMNRASTSELSTKTDLEWTFRSGNASAEGEDLPLWAVRYAPVVDDYNRAERRAVSAVPFRTESASGAKVGTVIKVEVQVSGDDGITWRRAEVRRIADNQYIAVFATPSGSHVSLTAKVADSNGNTTTQKIIRGYALK